MGISSEVPGGDSIGDEETAVVGMTSAIGLRLAEGRANADSLPPGSTVGDYVIEGLVGGGGGGTVYAAQHRALGKRVAVKVLRADMAVHPVMVNRFVLEATAVNEIDHPSIVKIHDFGEISPGRPYYVMELLDGVNLREFLKTQGRLPPNEMLRLIEPILLAVQAAHQAGFVHRDIKANNIMVIESNGARVTKLVDFGIAKAYQAEHAAQGLTEPGAQLGTAHNMAPEQVRGEKVDARTDVYALGVLIYQILTGQFPFDANDARTVALLHLQAPAPRPSALVPLSAAMDAVVLRCLEKRPDQRFSSVAELLSALRAAVGEDEVETDTSSAESVGVHVGVAIRDGEDMDDAFLDDVDRVLEIAESALASHEFVFPLRTSDALLGVRLSSEDTESERRRAELIVSELHALLIARDERHPGAAVKVAAAVVDCSYRTSPRGIEIVGGTVLDQKWTAESPDAVREA